MSIKSALFQMAAFAMIAGMDGNNMYSSRRIDNSKPYPKNADLPKFNVGGTIIHAKDEKTAIKYAKKRGVWKEGMSVVPYPTNVVIIDAK